MIILAIRTDKPQAELYLYQDHKQLAGLKWQAHLKLAETIHHKIEELLNKSSISYNDINALAVFKGPGSFTGLRIGMSVANALAYALEIPIVCRGGDEWLKQSVEDILNGQNDKIAVPEYGAQARTTTPRK